MRLLVLFLKCDPINGALSRFLRFSLAPVKRPCRLPKCYMYGVHIISRERHLTKVLSVFKSHRQRRTKCLRQEVCTNSGRQSHKTHDEQWENLHVVSLDRKYQTDQILLIAKVKKLSLTSFTICGASRRPEPATILLIPIPIARTTEGNRVNNCKYTFIHQNQHQPVGYNSPAKMQITANPEPTPNFPTKEAEATSHGQSSKN